MADNYNGVGGSFVIDPENGDVKPTIAVAEEKEIIYSPAKAKNLKGESTDGSTN